MFVTPICIVVVRCLLPAACKWSGIPPEIGYPDPLAAMLLVTINIGSSLEKWRLTGNHRIVSAMLMNGAEIMKTGDGREHPQF